MSNTRRAALLASVFSFSLAAFSAHAASLPRTEVEAIVKDYLYQHPEVIIDSIKHYQETQEKEADAKSKQALADSTGDLFKSATSPSVGSAKADVTVVEFFDYHCGYCKHMLPVITQVMKEDPKVRFVFKEFPILSEDSALASKAALAVYTLKPEKYFEYHTALMGMSSAFTEASLAAEAKKLGIDEAKFKTAMNSPGVEAELKKNQELGQKLGIRGTPAVILQNEMLPGAVSVEDLKASIKKQRVASK